MWRPGHPGGQTLTEPQIQALRRRGAILPQAGPQTRFLASKADIAVMGGAMWCGKTWALLMEPTRHTHRRDFGAVMFRRTTTEARAEGGLWDDSFKIYSGRARPRENVLDWSFRSGAHVSIAHMQHEKDRYDYKGSQIALLGFDQVEMFTRNQFWFMLSRNRSMCGIDPYVRATCNPVPEDDPIGGWLRELVDWWIDRETGYPIWERSGVVRWFIRRDDALHWADSREELVERFATRGGRRVLPKSFTFVPGLPQHNLLGIEANPGYLANLDALQLVDRERNVMGNWNVREAAGMFFQRGWFKDVLASEPTGFEAVCRYWDRAAVDAASPNASQASWTAGVKMGRISGTGAQTTAAMCHVERFQASWHGVRERIAAVGASDGYNCTIVLEQDPGQAGKQEAESLAGDLRKLGFRVEINVVRESKMLRAKPFSGACERGQIKIVRGAWNHPWYVEAENFDGTSKTKSDQVDAGSGAFFWLSKPRRQYGVLRTSAG